MERETPTDRAANFRFSAQLTWMGIKYFSRAALLDFPNVVGPNGSNADSEKVVKLKNMYPPF